MKRTLLATAAILLLSHASHAFTAEPRNGTHVIAANTFGCVFLSMLVTNDDRCRILLSETIVTVYQRHRTAACVLEPNTGGVCLWVFADQLTPL